MPRISKTWSNSFLWPGPDLLGEQSSFLIGLSGLKTPAKKRNVFTQSKLYHQVISYAKKGDSALSRINRLKRREIQISSVKNP